LPNPSWIEDFEKWLSRRGILVRDTPREPMSPLTVRDHISRIKRSMKLLGALGPNEEVLIRAREFTPDLLISYFDKAFPNGPRGNEVKWTAMASSIRKLAEYLHFQYKWRGRPVFSKKDLKQVRDEVYRVSAPKKKVVLSDELLDRYELQFLPWMKENNPVLWGPAKFMLLTGLRIHEVAGINVGLKTGTMIRLRDGDVEVTGKGKNGQKSCDIITLTEEAEQHLKEWSTIRENLDIDQPALFPSTTGRRIPLGYFNRQLKKAAKSSGLFEGDCDINGNYATGELPLLHAHNIGRAAFITNMTRDNINPIEGKELSRHKSLEVYAGYSRTDTRSAARRVSLARKTRKNETNVLEDDYNDIVDMILEDPKLKKILLSRLLKDIE